MHENPYFVVLTLENCHLAWPMSRAPSSQILVLEPLSPDFPRVRIHLMFTIGFSYSGMVNGARSRAS